MIKQTPSLGRIFAMVAFTLSCFGILVFLWLNFGGSVPLQPEGYRVERGLPVGHAARPGGGRAHLRREGREGEGQGAERADRPDRHDARDRRALRADPEGLARDPAPEVAAGRDLRGARARHALLGARAGRGQAGGGPGARTRSSSTRSCAASTRRRASASPPGSTRPASPRRTTREPLNDALALPHPVRRGHRRGAQVLRQQSDATQRFVRDTGVRLRRAHGAEGPAARPDPELEQDLGGDREPRRGVRRHVPRCCRPSCARAAPPPARLTRVRGQHQPADRPSCGPPRASSRRCSWTSTGWPPTSRGVFVNLDPLVRVSKRGLPATEQVLDNTQPLLRPPRSLAPGTSPRSSTTWGCTGARSPHSSGTARPPPREPRAASTTRRSSSITSGPRTR